MASSRIAVCSSIHLAASSTLATAMTSQRLQVRRQRSCRSKWQPSLPSWAKPPARCPLDLPLGVPADLQSAVKKVRPIKTGGFVIPQQKEKHTPLLRIANPQSINRLGHFLTPDYKSGGTPSGLACKSGGTPSGLAFLKKRRRGRVGLTNDRFINIIR